MSLEVLAHELPPVDRPRECATNADIMESELCRLVIKRQICQGRLLVLDHAQVGISGKALDMEQGWVLNAVDDTILERSGARVFVKQRYPADPVQVRLTTILHPANATAGVGVVPGHVHALAGPHR